MNTSTHEARTALITAAVLSLFSAAATAQVHPEKPTYKYEKCRNAHSKQRSALLDLRASGHVQENYRRHARAPKMSDSIDSL